MFWLVQLTISAAFITYYKSSMVHTIKKNFQSRWLQQVFLMSITVKWWMTYLTYSTSSHGGHRATTVSFHLVLSWSFLFASPRVVFMACSSEIIPLRHELFGLPLFLFPWWFHSKACFVMLLSAFLSVCPIHFHRLDLIVKLIGCCFVFLHSSLLLMVSGHLTPKIFLRQRFIKTWSVLIEDAVSLHVSEP